MRAGTTQTRKVQQRLFSLKRTEVEDRWTTVAAALRVANPLLMSLFILQRIGPFALWNVLQFSRVVAFDPVVAGRSPASGSTGIALNAYLNAKAKQRRYSATWKGPCQHVFDNVYMQCYGGIYTTKVAEQSFYWKAGTNALQLAVT